MLALGLVRISKNGGDDNIILVQVRNEKYHETYYKFVVMISDVSCWYKYLYIRTFFKHLNFVHTLNYVYIDIE